MVTEIDMRHIVFESIHDQLKWKLGRAPTFVEELAMLGAHPVGHSQVSPGRQPFNRGQDAGVREQS